MFKHIKTKYYFIKIPKINHPQERIQSQKKDRITNKNKSWHYHRSFSKNKFFEKKKYWFWGRLGDPSLPHYNKNGIKIMGEGIFFSFPHSRYITRSSIFLRIEGDSPYRRDSPSNVHKVRTPSVKSILSLFPSPIKDQGQKVACAILERPRNKKVGEDPFFFSMAVIDREDRNRFLSAGTVNQKTGRVNETSRSRVIVFEWKEDSRAPWMERTSWGKFPSVNNRLVPRGNRGLSHPSERVFPPWKTILVK